MAGLTPPGLQADIAHPQDSPPILLMAALFSRQLLTSLNVNVLYRDASFFERVGRIRFLREPNSNG
jgi:hypothetical protein